MDAGRDSRPIRLVDVASQFDRVVGAAGMFALDEVNTQEAYFLGIRHA